MANVLFVGFGLAKNRKEAVSKNTVSLAKYIRKTSKVKIFNVGYNKKFKGFLAMLYAVFNYKSIRADIAKVIKKNNISHLHDTFVMPGASLIFTLPLKKKFKHIKFIKEIHNSPGGSGGVDAESLIRRVLNTPNQLRYILNGFDTALSRNIYISKLNNIHYVPPEIKIYKKSRKQDGKNVINICYLGHALEKKGINEIINLMEIFPEELIPKVTFNFALSKIGKPDFFKAKISKVAANRNIAFKCFGQVKPDSFFRQQDILCLPLRDEFSSAASLNTVLESMEAGCLVVTTSTNISRAIIKHKKTGILIKDNASETLLRAIVKILENKKSISTITKEARADIINNYSWSNARNILRKIYE